MPTTRTWIGGGNNRANNQKDWSPRGAPQPGDTLLMNSELPMNISGNDLNSDLLETLNFATINLSGKAIADIGIVTGSLDVHASGTDTLNISQGFGQFAGGTSSTVELDSRTALRGAFALGVSPGDSFAINGATSSSFSNGNSSIGEGIAFINVDVIGNGTIGIGQNYLGTSKVEIGKSLGTGQSVTLGPDGSASELQIDMPNKFLGLVTLPGGEIDLMGLAAADSYTYQNDMLSIFSGNTVIDKLRMINQTPFGFAVEKTTGSVNVVAITDPTNPPVALPIHTSV